MEGTVEMQIIILVKFSIMVNYPKLIEFRY